jgi:hypothetical protein
MVKKKYRSRKNCIHYKNVANLYPEKKLNPRCFAKLSTWFCKGVNCNWYKEKTVKSLEMS